MLSENEQSVIEDKIAKKAIQLGILMKTHVKECSKIREQRIQEGSKPNQLSEILIEKGYIAETLWKNLQYRETFRGYEDNVESFPEIIEVPSSNELDIDLDFFNDPQSEAKEFSSDDSRLETITDEKNKEVKENEIQEGDSLDFTAGLLPESSSFDQTKKRYEEKAEREEEEDVEFEDSLPDKNWPEIPGYKLLKLLGKGAMGTVYKGIQVSMDRLVAIKVLDKFLATDKQFVERFMREACAVAQLNHENIIAGIDANQTLDGIYYFVMEYAEGEALSEILEKRGKLSTEKSLEYTLQIAMALEHAHGNGIVHRDIKPENVIVTKNGLAKLCDLGLAREVGAQSQLTMTGAAIGTPQYISPEQAKGKNDIDIRSDIYSLGASLYHMLVGRPPFPGKIPAVVCTMHVTQPFPDPRDLVPEIPETVWRIIQKCTEKKREKRYQEPSQLIQAIEEYLLVKKAPKSTSKKVKKQNKIEVQEVKTAKAKVEEKWTPQSTGGLDFIPLDDEKEKPPAVPPKKRLEKPKTEKIKKASRATPQTIKVIKKGDKPLAILSTIMIVLLIISGLGYLIYPQIAKSPKKTKQITKKKKKLTKAEKELRLLQLKTISLEVKNREKIDHILDDYQVLLKKYKDEPEYEKILKGYYDFRDLLEKKAKKYKYILQEIQFAQETPEIKSLKKALSHIKIFPKGLMRTNLGKRLQEKKETLIQSILTLLKKDAERSQKQEKYKEAIRVYEECKNYISAKNVRKYQKKIEILKQKYNVCKEKAEIKYGRPFREEFHEQLLKKNYIQAQKISKKYYQYYGLREQIESSRKLLELLQKIQSKKGKFQISEWEEKLKNSDFRFLVLGLLCNEQEEYKAALQYLEKVDPKYKDFYCKKIEENWEKKREENSRKLFEKAQRATLTLSKKIRYKKNIEKDLLKLQKILFHLRKEYGNTDLVLKEKFEEIRRIQAYFERIYLKEYAWKLYFNSTKIQLRRNKKHLRFEIYYSLKSPKQLKDFRIYCPLNRKKAGIKFSKEGLNIQSKKVVEIYWYPWKKFPRLKYKRLKAKLTSPESSINTGFIFKNQLKKDIEILNRYLFLIRFSPVDMCKIELKTKVPKIDYNSLYHVTYKNFLSKRKNKSKTICICNTKGKVGLLGRKLESLILAEELGAFEEKSHTIIVDKGKSTKFSMIEQEGKIQLKKKLKFSKKGGYVGLYTNSEVTFSDLVIEFYLEKKHIKYIQKKVLENRSFYAKRIPDPK